MATRKLKFGDREVVGEDVGFRIVNDGAVTMELDDGAHLRLRHIVVNVVKTNEKTPEGETLYLVQSANQVLLLKPSKEDLS